MSYALSTNRSSASSLGAALVVGAAIGYITSLFVSQETRVASRKEIEMRMKQLEKIMKDPDERQRIKEVFKDQTDEAMSAYHDTRDAVMYNIAQVTTPLEKISKQKYVDAVRDAISDLANRHELPSTQLRKLRAYLESDYNYLKRHWEKADTNNKTRSA
jgi:succinate dehydrogenase/fumarate reductase flavoprotein subunit